MRLALFFFASFIFLFTLSNYVVLPLEGTLEEQDLLNQSVAESLVGEEEFCVDTEAVENETIDCSEYSTYDEPKLYNFVIPTVVSLGGISILYLIFIIS